VSARRALVTGAGGFVGAGLARRLLDEGHEVTALVRPGSDPWRLRGMRRAAPLAEVDLRDAEAVGRAVRTARPEWVFHLAAHGAYSWQADPRGIFETNVLGLINLASACLETDFESLVNAGSSSEYGFKDHAPAEDELPEPNSEYAVTKASAMLLCGFLARRHGRRLSTLRLYSVYGPWEDPRRLVPTLAARGLQGELPPLVSPETGRDFVYLDDACDAFLAAASAPDAAGAVYNVGTGRQTTIREAVEVARRVLDIDAEPEWGTHEDRSWDTSVWVADPARIQRELGWRPRVDFENGFRRTVEWLRADPELARRYGLEA